MRPSAGLVKAHGGQTLPGTDLPPWCRGDRETVGCLLVRGKSISYWSAASKILPVYRQRVRERVRAYARTNRTRAATQLVLNLSSEPALPALRAAPCTCFFASLMGDEGHKAGIRR